MRFLLTRGLIRRLEINLRSIMDTVIGPKLFFVVRVLNNKCAAIMRCVDIFEKKYFSTEASGK